MKDKETFDRVIDYISHSESTFASEGSGRFPVSNFGEDISNGPFIPEDHLQSENHVKRTPSLSP